MRGNLTPTNSAWLQNKKSYEEGLVLGMCVNSQVLASLSKKRTYIKSPEDREWVLIVETVSATG